MILPDVNILVHAHRADSPIHGSCKAVVDQNELALCAASINGFLRLVTAGPFKPVTSPNVALAVVDEWLARPSTRILGAGARYWAVFSGLCRRHGAMGNAYFDVHLAALAIEHDAELWSLDNGFARFEALRWRCPAGS